MDSSNCSLKIIEISPPKKQTLLLPSSILGYIFKNANHFLLRKLHSTCKFFPGKYMYLILSEFSVQESDGLESFEYEQKSMRLSIGHSKAKELKNLYILTTFSFQNSNKQSLSKFIIPKIHRCEAKHIDIWGQNLSFSDFQVLASTEHVRQLYLEDVNIFIENESDEKENEKEFPLENIISHCLNATSITINHIKSSNICCTKNTSIILADLKLKSKLQTFFIAGLNDQLEPGDFCAFLKNNAAPKSVFTLSFKPLKNEYYQTKFDAQVNITRQYWLPARNRPIVNLNFFTSFVQCDSRFCC
uniref:Uncharacterized protein n=1 Tax=Panagrolaimus sp. PS1159 TaxID=55785 RepID=A0AC35G025_9BILA